MLIKYLEGIHQDPPPIGRKDWETMKSREAAKKKEKADKKIARQKVWEQKEEEKDKSFYKTKVEKIYKLCRDLGADIISDRLDDIKHDLIIEFKNSKKQPDDKDLRNFILQKAMDYAGDSVDVINERDKEILKRSGINDVNGRIADEMHDGMLEWINKNHHEIKIGDFKIKEEQDTKTPREIEKGYSRVVSRSNGDVTCDPRDVANWLRTQGFTEIMIHKKGYVTIDEEREEIVILSFKWGNKQFFAACNSEMNLFDVDTKPMAPKDYK